MSDIHEEEKKIIMSSNLEMIEWCMNKFIIPREIFCPNCSTNMKIEPCAGFLENFCWRCYNLACSNVYGRYSILYKTFFKGFGGSFRTILLAILRIISKQPMFSILQSLKISKNTLIKLKTKLIGKMKIVNAGFPKLGGLGKIINIDETMLNYKAKSHRGRSPSNKTDAICIVEIDNITKRIERVWAEILINKQASTIMPIILNHVIEHSVIYTDEFSSYKRLFETGYDHSTVCHKYNFVDPQTGVHTQFVESFNSQLKYQIKLQKGIKTDKRADFLSFFIWNWNSKKDILRNYLELIKF